MRERGFTPDRLQFTWIWRAVWAACLLPLVLLVGAGLRDALGANPIEYITRATGDWTLRLLLRTLAVTPLRQLTGWHWLVRLRRTLGLYFRQALNTRDYTPGDILNGCLPFGCQSEVVHGNERINAVTCLCWNYPCAGLELIGTSDGHLAPRVGYGLQTYPGQFLAMLALSRVPNDYPVRSGETVRTVADVVEFEKLDCNEDLDQSLRLLGLAHYLSDNKGWRNRAGEPWSVDRLVDLELAQPLSEGPCGGTHRLLALTVAVSRRVADAGALSDPITRAGDFLRDYHRYALKTQNPDGSWHPSFFAAVGATNDQAGQLRSTGHIAQWLTLSLSDQQLDQPEVLRMIDYLVNLLGYQQARWNSASLSSRNLEGLMCALHALATYDERVLRPCDPEPEPAADAAAKPAAK